MFAQSATASFPFPVFCIKQEKKAARLEQNLPVPGEEFSTPGTELAFDSQHWKADPAIQEATGDNVSVPSWRKNHP